MSGKTRHEPVACARCGIRRIVHEGRHGCLCHDCRAVVKREGMLAAWEDAA